MAMKPVTSQIIAASQACCNEFQHVLCFLTMATSREKKKVNLRDVARAAKVSSATVSRVLNSPKLVQEDTRKRVETAISELNFHRSAAALAINSGRTRIVGALIPTLENDIFALTIEAIEKRLGDFGYSLVVATTGEDPRQEFRRAQELLNIGVDGLIVSGVSHDETMIRLFDKHQVPVIATSYYDPEFGYPTIGYDNFAAARMALDHILELGRTHVAVVHGPELNNDRTRARVAGARCKKQGVEQSFFETEMSVAGGAKAAVSALSSGTTIDAFLCVSDVIALGVLFEIQRQGVSVPDDISVVSIHDLPISQTVSPRLTTVRLPARQMGTQAAEALANWLDHDIRPKPVCLESTLIKRETT